MAYLNKVILIGNVGKDPETGSTPSGASFSKFSLATSRKYKGSNLPQHTMLCHSVCKGSSLCVEGSISYRSWDDKTTGQKRYITEIIANNIQLLGSRPQQQNAQPAQNQQPQPSEDDLPF